MEASNRIMSVIVGIMLIAFYFFLYNKARTDEMNNTCNSSWWLKFLAVIGCIPLVLGIIMILFTGAIMQSKLFGLILLAPIIFMAMCFAFYVFLFRKATADEQNKTCNSIWWVKCLSIIGGILAVIKVLVGLFGTSSNFSFEYTKTYN